MAARCFQAGCTKKQAHPFGYACFQPDFEKIKLCVGHLGGATTHCATDETETDNEHRPSLWLRNRAKERVERSEFTTTIGNHIIGKRISNRIKRREIKRGYDALLAARNRRIENAKLWRAWCRILKVRRLLPITKIPAG